MRKRNKGGLRNISIAVSGMIFLIICIISLYRLTSSVNTKQYSEKENISEKKYADVNNSKRVDKESSTIVQHSVDEKTAFTKEHKKKKVLMDNIDPGDILSKKQISGRKKAFF